jgi:hypothetical protein
MPASPSSVRVACSIAVADPRTRVRRAAVVVTRKVLVCGLLAAIASVLAPASASALTDYTWVGAAAPGSANWSSATNWGGSAPSGSVGTLTFPALTSGACTATPPTATCYASTNDVVGLNASGISIDDGESYVIDGNAITLGSGGITAAPSASDTGFGGPSFNAPITLGASQTWSVTGGSNNQQITVAKVDGAADNLTIDFASEPFLTIEDHAEVGTFTVSSQGVVSLNSASLNGATGNAVDLSHGGGLFVSGGASSSGPLSLNEDSLQVGAASASAVATLAVNGGITLGSTNHTSLYINHSGTVPGTDYSQISATGNVSLGGASLQVWALCKPGTALTPGDVDTLITTTGSLSGTFSGVPDGTTVQAQCLPGAGETAPSVKINYTAHTVTATVVTGGSGGTTVPSSTSLHTSSGTPAIGEVVTYTARVIPQVFAGAEPSGSVEFFDGGSPIPGCSAQPLTESQSGSTATCMASYPAAGTHTISATYLGDAFYASSTTTGVCCTVTVQGGSEERVESQEGGGPQGGGSTPAPLTPVQPSLAPHRKHLKCKRGFKKKVVHGKARCVKRKRREHARAG